MSEALEYFAKAWKRRGLQSDDLFKEYEEIGMQKGFDIVESSPLVRSSYHAERHVFPNKNK